MQYFNKYFNKLIFYGPIFLLAGSASDSLGCSSCPGSRVAGAAGHVPEVDIAKFYWTTVQVLTSNLNF